MIVAFLLQLLGLALVGAAMHGAPRVVKLRAGARRRHFAAGGWGGLALSVPVALWQGPIGLQVLNWFGLFSLSAAAVLLSFTALTPRRVKRLGE